MATPSSILVTPNICGADGISAWSRQVAATLPPPVVVLSLHDDSGATAAGARIEGAGHRRVRLLACAARLMTRCGPDTIIVCAHVHLAPVARLLAWRAARSTFVLHGIEAWAPLKGAEPWALRSGALVAVSEHTSRRFKAANPAFRDVSIRVVHFGLPLSTYAADDVQVLARPMALIVGRMAADERYKGHDLLIDVWPRVLAVHPEAELCVVGDGTDRARLEAKAAAEGLAHSITFTGPVDDDTLVRLYRQCRFFVMPSRDEGFGLVFLEAMRAGKACIGGRGAAAEIIVDGETGIVVDPSNADEVCHAMTRLFDDADGCRRLGQAGEIRFRTMFTDVHFRSRLLDALAASRA
jgi:phosphatidyl-myo-inositol dimannoside synthase